MFKSYAPCFLQIGNTKIQDFHVLSYGSYYHNLHSLLFVLTLTTTTKIYEYLRILDTIRVSYKGLKMWNEIDI